MRPRPAPDVVVAGGGPAGCAAAIALSRAGWSVCIVDRGRPGRPPIGESLPSAALPLLDRLGLAGELAAGPHARVRARRSVWGWAAPLERPSVSSAYGDGWLLDRERFDGMLRAAASQAGTQLVAGRVQYVKRAAGQWVVRCAGGGSEPLRTRAIVDATGRSASVARRLGAVVQRPHPLVAACTLSAHDAPATAMDAVTFVEAVGDGWWYSAPLPDGRYSVQLVTRPELWREHRDLAARLRSAPGTWTRVGQLVPDPAIVVPAGSAFADPSAGPGWIAVGDAAAAHDPLAAAGLTTALRSGARAAQALGAWLRDGDMHGLATYSRMQAAAFAAYRRQRAAIYALEPRWPDAPFWAGGSPAARRGELVETGSTNQGG